MTRRYAVITVATAALVIGGGVAFGSTQQQNPPVTPSPMPSASQIKSALEQQCEQAREQFRQQHPEGYDGGCNYGSATLTIP
jgi:hypothetical protein